ncbi:MAG: Uncharacterised protein [Cryomorphaceae bacterium]|nr:MAG: Uncharacterised protein [Cryomorphaceae bacterium]
MDGAGAVFQKRSIDPEGSAFFLDGFFAFPIKVNRIFRVFHDRAVRLDLVRHIRVDKKVIVEVVAQRTRLVLLDKFEEFQQVDDLMIPPVADVRPRVVRFDRFPVESVFSDAVRVVPIESCCVEEFVNHSLHKLWVAVCKCFPILEDITPVSLVVEDFRTVLFVTCVDGKFIPRARRIAMAAAKLQRQVLEAQAFKIEIRGIRT